MRLRTSEIRNFRRFHPTFQILILFTDCDRIIVVGFFVEWILIIEQLIVIELYLLVELGIYLR